MIRYSFILSFILIFTHSVQAQEAQMRGWIEHARIMPDRLLMSAKLDSGAQTTSVHAEILPSEAVGADVQESRLARWLADKETDAKAMLSTRMVDGQAPDDPPAGTIETMQEGALEGDMPETVTFRLTSRGGREEIYTEPVVRWVSIRRRGGGSIVRPVVLMDLCVAGVRVQGEVNLADRTGFNYPLLIGRNMLSDAAISVDSRQIFASKRACPETD